MRGPRYEVLPYRCVGEIEFTDSKEVVRKKIGGRYNDGKHEFNGLVELFDFFPEEDIKVIYDECGQVGAIEFYS